MTTMEGGMIACSNPEVAEQVKILRAHGWVRNVDPNLYDLGNYDIDPRYAFVNWGFNVRPTDIQAGFGLHQLQKLPEFNQRRIELANKFFSFIDNQPFLQRPYASPKANPTWFALPMLVTGEAPFTRKDIVNYLESQGVETRPIVAGNIAKHPVANIFPEFHEDTYAGANIIHEQGFYLGLSPFHTEVDIDKLIKCFETFFRHY
jgi:CDP-6-deoxy-D-xylo-4-hexulose-3-dehydrase